MAEEITKITVIGCGPGGADYITPIARKTALSMDILAGASRLFDLFPEFCGKKIPYKGTAKMLDDIAAASGDIGVLVSGDVTYFSLAESVIKRFGLKNCNLIPGISSIQVALSSFGLKQNTTRIISAHAGMPEQNPDTLINEESIVLLGGNKESTDWIISLAELTAATHNLSICIDLTLETEQVLTLQNPTPDSLLPYLEYSRIILILHQKM